MKFYSYLPLVTYEPAQLHEWNSGWVVEYRILNPNTGVLEKKRLKYEKVKKRLGIIKGRQHAKLYCKAINEKLESGWNPYKEGKHAKAFHSLLDAIKSFLKEKELDMKNGVFSSESMRTYKSQSDVFIRWIQSKNNKINVGAFDKVIALEYMDYV